MLLAAGVFVGAAAAGPIPVPPVPTVPVSLPPTPVPLPAIPTLPKPVVPVAPSATSTVTHTAAALAPAAAGVASTASSAGPTGSSPVVYGGAGSSSGPPATSSDDARVDHFQSSRDWIGTTGPKRRRTTTLTFVVPHATRIVIIVNQLAPACVGVGRFSVAAHAGVNHVRFAGRVHGRRLAPGTYRISVRTPSGHVIRRITLVVVGGSAPSRGELRALRAANACHGGSAPSSSAYTTGGGTSAAPPTGATAAMPAQPLPRPAARQKGAAIGVATPDINSGVLASSVEKTARAIRPLLVALLALSILLLGVASLPRIAVPEPRVHDLLARHRVEIAGLGAAALVAVAIAFLV